MAETTIINSTEGRARIKGLDLTFTSASEVNKKYVFGSEVVDAATDKPVRLPGRPTFDALTLTTPLTEAAIKKISTWGKTKDSQPGNVAVTVVVAKTMYFTFTGCSVSQMPISPGMDADSDMTTANKITIIIEVTNNSLTDVKYNA